MITYSIENTLTNSVAFTSNKPCALIQLCANMNGAMYPSYKPNTVYQIVKYINGQEPHFNRNSNRFSRSHNYNL